MKQTFCLRRKKRRLEMQEHHSHVSWPKMASRRGDQRKTLRKFVTLWVQDITSSIARLNVEVNNFDLKPTLILMMQESQFGGTLMKDPNLHLSVFLEVCNTLKLNGVLSDYIGLRLFSFSLRDKVRAWSILWLQGQLLVRMSLLRSFLPNSSHCLCSKWRWDAWWSMEMIYGASASSWTPKMNDSSNLSQ